MALWGCVQRDLSSSVFHVGTRPLPQGSHVVLQEGQLVGSIRLDNPSDVLSLLKPRSQASDWSPSWPNTQSKPGGPVMCLHGFLTAQQRFFLAVVCCSKVQPYFRSFVCVPFKIKQTSSPFSCPYNVLWECSVSKFFVLSLLELGQHFVQFLPVCPKRALWLRHCAIQLPGKKIALARGSWALNLSLWGCPSGSTRNAQRLVQSTAGLLGQETPRP